MECLTHSINGVKIVAKMEEDSIKEMFAGSKCGVNNGLTEVRIAKIINIEQGQDRKSSKFV